MKKILILCVDYHSSSDTTKFVNTVLNIHPSVNVVLVLNSGAQHFENDFFSRERLFTYDFGSNLGYMQGASNGLKAYLESNELPDWVILSNTDIMFPDISIFERLSNDARDNLIIAPDIISSDGVHQNPFLVRRLAKNKLKFLVAINSSAIASLMYNFLAKIKSKIKVAYDKSVSSPLDIYAPHGAFIIIASSYFSRGGSLDHPTFLYGEELILAERAARIDIKISYDKSYKIIHAEHVATGKMPGTFRSKALKESLNAVLEEYY